jgi:hypothetical protein
MTDCTQPCPGEDCPATFAPPAARSLAACPECECLLHACPACDAVVDPRFVLGDLTAGFALVGGHCPDCGTDREVIRLLAKGVVERDQLEQAEYGTEWFVPAEVRQEIDERVAAKPDPADEEVSA